MKSSKVMQTSIITNLFLAVFKFGLGVFTNSQAIISEGIDSIMDSINNAIALYAIKRSHDPADKEHPLGHGKVEYVASLVLSIFIMTIGLTLLVKIGQDINNTVVVPEPSSLIVLVISTAVKIVLAMYLLRSSKTLNNQLIYSLGKENLADILRSSVAFIGIVLSLLSLNFNLPFLKYGDIIAGAIISFYIIYNGFTIFKDSVSNILGKSADDETVVKYKGIINNVKGVSYVKWLDLIKSGPFYLVLVEVCVDGEMSVDEAHDITIEIEKTLKSNHNISYVSIHIEPTKR